MKWHVTVAKFSSSQIFVDSSFRCPQLPTKITKFCTQRIFPAIWYLTHTHSHTQVLIKDLFGTPAEERGVKEVISKIPEGKNCKSGLTFGLIARFLSPSLLPTLLQPVKEVCGTTSGDCFYMYILWLWWIWMSHDVHMVTSCDIHMHRHHKIYM